MVINTILILIAITVAGLALASEDWRWRIASLSVIQLLGFILIIQIWPIALASVKLISGWMGTSLLGTSMIPRDSLSDENVPLSSKIYKLALMALGWVVIAASIPSLNNWLPIEYTNLYIGMLFVLGGVFLLSLHNTAFEVLTGLLVFLVGFDVIYSSLEGSALVTGVYGMIVILISLAGVYFQGGLNFGGEK